MPRCHVPEGLGPTRLLASSGIGPLLNPNAEDRGICQEQVNIIRDQRPDRTCSAVGVLAATTLRHFVIPRGCKKLAEPSCAGSGRRLLFYVTKNQRCKVTLRWLAGAGPPPARQKVTAPQYAEGNRMAGWQYRGRSLMFLLAARVPPTAGGRYSRIAVRLCRTPRPDAAWQKCRAAIWTSGKGGNWRSRSRTQVICSPS